MTPDGETVSKVSIICHSRETCPHEGGERESTSLKMLWIPTCPPYSDESGEGGLSWE
ncbi:MAG: hypothetical protein PVH88_21185 [Ignavibacteria bacterium]|jgi:hypothetical protein